MTGAPGRLTTPRTGVGGGNRKSVDARKSIDDPNDLLREVPGLLRSEFFSSLLSSPHLSLACTLRILSSIVWSRSTRVPSLITVEIRGAPMAWTVSWQRLIAAKTASHPPSMFVP